VEVIDAQGAGRLMAPPFSPAELADRAAIQDVIVRYCNALDRRDHGEVATCFTAGARAEYGGVALEPGVDSIIGFLRQLRAATDERHAGTHLSGNLLITLDGDEATAESYAIAYSVPPDSDAGAPIKMRGVRYRDRLVREDGGWKIAERIHTADWEGAMPNLPLTPIRPQER
jgi:hypothetical protein